MLEDRKFFDPVGAQQSPWKAIGPAGRVAMDRDKPFVGEQTPVIALSGDGAAAGIAQGALTLRKGKEYVGRVWLSGSPDVGPVEVSLVWGDGPDGRQTATIDRVTADYTKTPLRFTAGADTGLGPPGNPRRRQGPLARRHGVVDARRQHPRDEGRHAGIAQAARLRRSIAGRGAISSAATTGRTASATADRRPPRKNPAWQGIEHNDFGLDEFMAFCRLVGTEPYITVNSGLGDAAKRRRRKSNTPTAPADRPGGRLRAANGHAKPYGVKWWSVGNEMYGDWQLGHVPLEKYIATSQRVRRGDAGRRPVDQAGGGGRPRALGREGMLRNCADQMDLDQRALLLRRASERPGRPTFARFPTRSAASSPRTAGTASRCHR